jgi:hypothetical protein
MKPMIRYLCVVIALVASAPFAAAQPKETYYDFYPLKKGYRWIYRATDAKSAQPKKTIIEVDRQEVYTRTVKKGKEDVQESFIGYILKQTSGSKISHDYVVVIEDDGLYRIHTAETPANPPVPLIKFKAGEKWDYSSLNVNAPMKGVFSFKGKAEVTVPLRKFEAETTYLFSFRSADSAVEIDWWYAKNVGLVKQRTKLKNSESTLELEGHNVPPPK